MTFRLTLWVVGFALAMAGHSAEAAKLSKKARAAVEDGTATPQQKMDYVGHTMTDEVRRYALLQAWSANPAEFPIESYTAQISADQVPKLFRGTDAGDMLIENGAVSICLMEEPCGDHLADIAVQMNQLPTETLVAAYRQKSQIDVEIFREKIGSNVSTAIASVQEPEREAKPTSSIAQPIASEGQILDFMLDPYTKETITRIVTGNGNQQIVREENGSELILANLASTGEKYLITTQDGRRFQADQVKLTYFGFLLISDNELHSYDGQNHQQLFFPEGFGAAQVQRNDVYETGAILLERKSDGGEQFLDFSSLGRALGMNQKLDYALLNLRNGHAAFFNVDLAGKDVHFLSNCVPKKDGLFNECSEINKQEALYDKDGFINNDHYLWAIDWARTPEGLYAVVQEGSKITVTDMTSGERKLAFKRGMGINWFELEKAADGSLALTAKLGFKKRKIENLVEEFDGLPTYERTDGQ